MIKFIKNNVLYLVPVIVVFLLVYLINVGDKHIGKQNALRIEIELEHGQTIKLKEISKKEFRDSKHTLLMLVDDYIKYHENNEVVK